MRLTAGSRLGPYDIQSAIGAGGMGEVYLATDRNLAREVAIKVLPEAFAQDAERLARFEREARTLASISHPNIAIVHGLERVDAHGLGAGDQRAGDGTGRGTDGRRSSSKAGGAQDLPVFR